MKIYTYVKMDLNGNVVDEVSYEYEGAVARCDSGGEKTKTTQSQQQTGSTNRLVSTAETGLQATQRKGVQAGLGQIMPILQGFFGQGTPAFGETAAEATEFRRQAGRSGVAAGDPRLAQGVSDIFSKATMPNDNVTKAALRLFPILSQIQGAEGAQRTTASTSQASFGTGRSSSKESFGLGDALSIGSVFF